MDYRKMAERALEQRGVLFERRKEIVADESMQTDERRSALSEIDRQMDSLATEAREAAETGERDAEIRNLMGDPRAAHLNAASRADFLTGEARYGEPMPADSSFRDLLKGKPASDREFGDHMRAMVRGENRATTFQSENTDNLGGYLVNPRYAANVLDLARAKTRVMQAGASVIPMETLEEKVAKLVTDPTPAWRNERDAISGSGIEFGEVALKAKSLACLAKVPFELVEDAANFGRVLRHALAQSFAVSLDAASLTGSGVDPEPLGLLNAGITEIASADGGSPSNWADFIAGVRTVREANYSPSGVILPEADEAALASLTGSDGHYVSAPAYVADVPRYTSGNMPAVALSGEGAVFGDWQHLFIGMRTSFEIKVLNERYADTGEIGIIGWLRGDVQVAQSDAFAMIRRAAA